MIILSQTQRSDLRRFTISRKNSEKETGRRRTIVIVKTTASAAATIRTTTTTMARNTFIIITARTINTPIKINNYINKENQKGKKILKIEESFEEKKEHDFTK